MLRRADCLCVLMSALPGALCDPRIGRPKSSPTPTIRINSSPPSTMPLPVTTREKQILAALALLIVLGLIGMAVL